MLWFVFLVVVVVVVVVNVVVVVVVVVFDFLVFLGRKSEKVFLFWAFFLSIFLGRNSLYFSLHHLPKKK